MLIYVNGQIIDSKETDLLILGFEDNERQQILNMDKDCNTLALFGPTHNTTDIRAALKLLKKALAAREMNTENYTLQ